MSKRKDNKIILKVIREETGKLVYNVEGQINEVFEIIINLLGELSVATKIEYNQILDDLKETKTKGQI